MNMKIGESKGYELIPPQQPSGQKSKEIKLEDASSSSLGIHKIQSLKSKNLTTIRSTLKRQMDHVQKYLNSLFFNRTERKRDDSGVTSGKNTLPLLKERIKEIETQLSYTEDVLQNLKEAAPKERKNKHYEKALEFTEKTLKSLEELSSEITTLSLPVFSLEADLSKSAVIREEGMILHSQQEIPEVEELEDFVPDLEELEDFVPDLEELEGFVPDLEPLEDLSPNLKPIDEKGKEVL